MDHIGELAQAQLRVALENFASHMAREVIGPKVPEAIQFAFVAFDAEGNVAYCSSGQRGDVAKAMRFLIDKWSKEQNNQIDVDAEDDKLATLIHSWTKRAEEVQGIAGDLGLEQASTLRMCRDELMSVLGLHPEEDVEAAFGGKAGR